MCLIEEKGAYITFDEQYWSTRKCYFQEIAKSGDFSYSLVKPSPFLDHTVVVIDIFSLVCLCLSYAGQLG
jgi:hypothetical protein